MESKEGGFGTISRLGHRGEGLGLLEVGDNLREVIKAVVRGPDRVEPVLKRGKVIG